VRHRSRPATANRKGRPPIAISDALFCAVFKIYSTMSARRFTSDLCDAQDKGYIDKVPHFNSVLNTLENPEMFDVLVSLIEQSSLPLRSIEVRFCGRFNRLCLFPFRPLV
jgi:hypothetical protein